MRKTTRFRELLLTPRLEFLLEAHNGLSARVAEEAGFSGIWASGLCLSAQYGVRDNNEASWTQILEMLEFMADATSVPILLDGDTGYGNFNNVRRLVRKLEQRGIAALCIEDKLFPKANSFLEGEAQPLASIEEFAGKIRAGKDAAQDDDFVIVARTEALIAGWGMAEALRRSEAYVEAGADAILIHSSQATADEVLAFRNEWGDRAPVVIVPTKYWRTPTQVFRDAGFSLAIWANHVLRSSLAAMQKTARALAREQTAAAVENEIAPLSEVFRLQGVAELKEAETRFLPRASRGDRAILLAATRGVELGKLTEDRPKAMVDVAGQPLLAHIVSAFKLAGVHRVHVVRGYKKEALSLPGLHYVDNDLYETTGELHSLALALDAVGVSEGALYVGYGDVLFRRHALELLLDLDADVALVVDSNWQESANLGRDADYASCSSPPTRRSFGEPVRLKRMAADLPEAERHGEWIGLLKIAPPAWNAVRETTAELLKQAKGGRPQVAALLNRLVAAGLDVQVTYTAGNWLDVDSLYDVIQAGKFSAR
ncbi:MAG: phosphoenolpyruvate mutase [Planctomycetes bacterium]|nr:phosphoenolpyruvate mutase [Planctomycetota bacterium]